MGAAPKKKKGGIKRSEKSRSRSKLSKKARRKARKLEARGVGRPLRLVPHERPKAGAGSIISGGMIHDLDQNADLRGSKWYGSANEIGVARKMERDAHVRQSLRAISVPIKAAVWDFKPASKSDLDIEVADFCRHAFLECIPWKSALVDIMRYQRDGFSLLECVEKTQPVSRDRFPNHPGNGTGVVMSEIRQIPAWTVDGWNQDPSNTRRLKSFVQYLPGSDQEDPGPRTINIRKNNVLRFTWEQEGANFEGLAPLRSAYGPWKVKLLLTVLDAIRHERMGVGQPEIKLPEDAGEDEIALAEVILAEMRSHEKGYILLPFGFQFSWKQTQGEGTSIAIAIKRANFDIAHNVGAGFTMLGGQGGGEPGSFALANTQAGQYQINLGDHSDFIVEVINFGVDGYSPIESLVRLNYGKDVALPRFVARNLPTKDYNNLIQHLPNLAHAGYIKPDDVLEVHLRELFTFPPRDEDTTREPKQAQKVPAKADNQEQEKEAA